MELTREYLDGELAKLTALADSVKAKQGSAAQRAREATEQAMGVDVTFSDNDDVPRSWLSLLGDVAEGEGAVTVNLGQLAQAVHAIDEWAAQVANECVTGILKQAGDDNSLATLKEQYAKQRDVVEALVTVFTAATDIDVSDVVLPTLRAPRTTSAPSQRKGKRGHFYRVVDGERREQSDQQDTLSSVAWYFGAAITEQTGKGSTNNGKGVPTAELEKYLRAQGIDSPLGKPWTLEREGVTFGMEIVGGDEAKSEEE